MRSDFENISFVEMESSKWINYLTNMCWSDPRYYGSDNLWYHVLSSERITQYSWWTSTLNSICPEHGQCYHLHQIKKCHWVANTAHKIFLVSNLSCSLGRGRTTPSKGEPVSTICMQCDNSKIDHQCNFGPRIWVKCGANGNNLRSTLAST
jgi:hypothetical protein